MIRKIVITVVVLGLIGATGIFYLWNKPHEKAEDEKAVKISAIALCSAYTHNEDSANTIYLNKVIQVQGIVGDINKNQDGGVMIVLASDDPVTGVQCTMRDKVQLPQKGETVTIAGFCSGSDITGVLLTDCILK